MPDLGQELYEHFLLNCLMQGISTNKGWKDLTDEQKQVWRDTASDFAKTLK